MIRLNKKLTEYIYCKYVKTWQSKGLYELLRAALGESTASIIVEWLKEQCLVSKEILCHLDPLTNCPPGWTLGWKICLKNCIAELESPQSSPPVTVYKLLKF